jgi:hypothetical protein
MINANPLSTQVDANINAAGKAPSIPAKARTKMTLTERAPTTNGQCTLEEFTIGAQPDRLLMDVVRRVKSPALQDFLTTVLQEAEIHQALTTATFVSKDASAHPSTHPGRATRHKQPSASACSCPIHALRRVAETAAYWSACGGEERDVLFVATLLRGSQQLLAPFVLGGSTVDDVMFTLVRRSLHRLDDQAPRCSRLLRLALGWGCADEIDEHYVPRLQIAVERALAQVAFGSHMSAPSTRSHSGSARLSSFNDTEQCQA